jgi:DNA-binding CsgD family transcriptional regulator
VVAPRTPAFTERQRQVVVLVALGYSNDEIAADLEISPRTARMHCDAVRMKLGVTSRREIPSVYRLVTGDDVLRNATRRRRRTVGRVATAR